MIQFVLITCLSGTLSKFDTFVYLYHRQIMHDCDFLEGIGVMDYSLLVGMHIRRASNSDLLPRGNKYTQQEP